MGFFDRAKSWLGIGSAEQEGEAAAREDRRREAEGSSIGAEARGDPGATPKFDRAREPRRKDGRERPALKEVEPSSSVTLEDALQAREEGDSAQFRQILREIDKGGGLRTVLRAAAALEAGDEDELAPLLPIVSAEEPAWKLPLQIAAALADPQAAGPHIDRATRAGAPAWAIAWSRALSTDAGTCREGLVELLFTDASLARAVAARDLQIERVVSDPLAAQRYTSFAYGRDSIRKFGAPLVAKLLDRAAGRQ